MTERLPRVTAAQVLRALHRDGWRNLRQSGSHIVLVHARKPGQVIVASHSGTIIKPGTMASILKQAGLSIEEFRRFL